MIFEAELTDWNKLECSDNIKKHMTQQIEAYNKSYKYKIILKNADHVVFSDFALFSRMPVFTKLPTQTNMFCIGTIDGAKAIEIVKQYLVCFFDQELKGRNCQLLEDGINDINYQSVVK